MKSNCGKTNGDRTNILFAYKQTGKRKKFKRTFVAKKCPDFLLCLFVCHIIWPVYHGNYNIEINIFDSEFYDLNRVFEFFRKKLFFAEIWQFLWFIPAVFSTLYELLCLQEERLHNPLRVSVWNSNLQTILKETLKEQWPSNCFWTANDQSQP